jgi:DNA (cytosine-5)-methyltransferase 1
MNNDFSNYKVLDLFAGAGGFSLGFDQAGAIIVGAIETDAWATDTFKLNHPDAVVIKSDITKLSDEEIKKKFRGEKRPNVILGGPPCQGFSICNKNAGDIKDPRNTLFTEFLRVARLFDPELLIMENVPNLIKAKTASKEKVVDIVTREMEAMGYHVYKTLMEAYRYGVPQNRKRLIVLGLKTKLEQPFPAYTHKLPHEEGDLPPCPTLWEAISDLPQVKPREGSEEMDYNNIPHNWFQEYSREGSANKVYNHLSMKHSKRMIERFESMSWGQSVSDVADHLKPLARNGNGKVSKTTYDQNNRRQHPDRVCNTITASFYANFVHPHEHRNFTAREGARIQSFPDYFRFLGKPTVVSRKLLQREGRFDENYLCQYNQIGNAVPPMMAKALALNTFKQLEGVNRGK